MGKKVQSIRTIVQCSLLYGKVDLDKVALVLKHYSMLIELYILSQILRLTELVDNPVENAKPYK